jgi:hypothetical protein
LGNCLDQQSCHSEGRKAFLGDASLLEAVMVAAAVRFIGIDPATPGGKCPAVFVDEETGDFLFQGWTVTDPSVLAQVAAHSPIADYESVVRLPARMREIILEALGVAGHIKVGGPADAQ